MTDAWGDRFLAAMVAAGILVSIDLENGGPLSANAFELPVESKAKQDSFSDTGSFKGHTSDSSGWFSLKLDGTVWNINPTGASPSYSSLMLEPHSLMLEPSGSDPNQLLMEKSTLADSRVTLGMLDDWMRVTARQAVSNYITPGTSSGYLMLPGLGLDNAAASQRIDTAIWKTGSTRVSLFAENDRVGAYFEAPTFAIKHQDPFSTPNSTTTRLGGAFQQGPITLTLEQHSQQSLAQDNAPVKVENQIGLSLDFDESWARSSGIPEGLAWVVPTSAYVSVGQGRVRAALDQGVNGDTMSDVSAGFSWNRSKVFAYLGYWRSDYQSQLYPWSGSGFDGSLGYHEGQWGVDLYFDYYRSITSSALAATQPVIGVQQSSTQASDVMSAGLALFVRGPSD